MTIDFNNIPNKEGFFGNYGGAFIEDNFKKELLKIEEAFEKIKNDIDFINELQFLKASLSKIRTFSAKTIDCNPELAKAR